MNLLKGTQIFLMVTGFTTVILLFTRILSFTFEGNNVLCKSLNFIYQFEVLLFFLANIVAILIYKKISIFKNFYVMAPLTFLFLFLFIHFSYQLNIIGTYEEYSNFYAQGDIPEDCDTFPLRHMLKNW